MSFATDSKGQVHMGTVGLFDDHDEYQETQDRLWKKELRRLEKEDKRKQQRARIAEAGPRSFIGVLKLLVVPLWGKTREKSSQKRSESVHGHGRKSAVCRSVGASTSVHGYSHYKPLPPLPTASGYRGYDDQSTSTSSEISESGDEMYPESSIHPEPSIFLEECGMVRVRCNKLGNGGWTVVPRSAILWGQ